MAHLCLDGDLGPITAPLVQQLADFDVERFAHAVTIAKFCDMSKQHFAMPEIQTLRMSKKPVNQRIAEALRDFMGQRWTNVALAKESGVAEATIRNYLSPEKRQQGASGKAPSAKATELEALAWALGLDVTDLVADMTPEERQQLYRRRAADHYAEHGTLPAWAPEATSEKQQRQARG